MKKMFKYVLMLGLILFMASCETTGSDKDPDDISTKDISDTLFYSLDRLSLVDLDINLDALIETAPESANTVSNRLFLNTTKLQTQSPGTTTLDTEIDLITYSDIPDSSNIGLEFRNLNAGISSYALSSKERVDWALENIRIMDTWVILGNLKYQLSYDETEDIVTLSTANVDYQSEDDLTYNLTQIEVYYNDKGLLVVTVSDAYKIDGYANFGKLTFIPDVLYEWVSDTWVNGVLEKFPNSGGPGWFKAYKNEDTGLWMYLRSTDRNISFNVQMATGWIQTFVRLAGFEDAIIEKATFDYVKVGNQSLDNDVFTFNFVDGDFTTFTFYPTAFTGWSEITSKISETERKNLNDWNPTVNPFLDLYDTEKATIIFENAYVSADPIEIETSVRSSNVDDINGDYYVAYVIESRIRIEDNYLNMLEPIKDRFKLYGFEYKYGSLEELFNETIETILNLPRIFDYFELSGVRGFTDLTKYQTVVEEELNSIHSLARRFDVAFELSPSVNFIDIEAFDLDEVSFINMNGIVSGAATYDPSTNRFDTSSIVVAINPSVLLQRDENYTIVYGLLSEQSFTYLGQELPVTYVGEAFNGNGGLNQELTKDQLFDGAFVLVGFIARVTDTGYIRVSNVSVIPFESFDETLEVVNENGFAIESKVTFNEGLFVTINTRDEEAPTITVNINDGEIVQQFKGDLEENVINIEIDTNSTLTLSQALESLSITDNSLELIQVALLNIEFNGASVSAFDQLLSVGTYVITISDSSDNVTQVRFVITQKD
jgi:hypothetical protein